MAATLINDPAGEIRMPNLSADDRNAISDVLHEYIWCMDIGDIEGIVRCFTPDATVKDITGRRWEAPDGPRNFAGHFINRPDRPAAQHWNQRMQIEDAPGGGVRVTSYWMTSVDHEGERPTLSNLGRYIDTLVKVQGRWLIAEKQIDPWNQTLVKAIRDAR
jgi:SnoaL-like domain